MALSNGDRSGPDGVGESWTTRDGRSWHKSLSPKEELLKVRGKASFLVCDKEVPFQRIQSLPAEPDALRAALREMMLHNDDGPVAPEYQDRFLVSCLIGLLGDQPAPPKVRAAAFRSLAGLPGAERLGSLKDSTGREGTGLVITSGDSRDKLIIDLETSLVLETENTQTMVQARGEQKTLQPEGQKAVQTRTYYKVGWTDVAPS